MGGQQYYSRGPERQPLRDPESVMTAIRDEAGRQRDNPPSGDPIIAAMWGGALSALEKDAAFRDLVEDYAAKHHVIVKPWTVEGVPDSEVNGLLRTALQFDSIRNGIRFPETKTGWERQIRNMASDPARRSYVEYVLDQMRTMTTTGYRQAPFEVVRQLKGEPAGFLDGGSSVGIGARQTQLKDSHPFAPVRLLSEGGRDDELSSRGYASLVGAPILRGNIVLFDRVPPDNWLARQLSIASLRPVSEIMNPAFMEERRQLLGAKLSNLVFVQGDLTDKDSIAMLKERCQGMDLRLAFVGTVLNQVGQENVDEVIDNVLDALEDHPDSEVVISEFAKIDRRRPSTLSLLPQWRQAGYRYFSVSKHDRGRIQPLFTFTSSRPEVGRVEGGSIVVGGETAPLRELLAARAAGAVSVRASGHGPLALSMFA